MNGLPALRKLSTRFSRASAKSRVDSARGQEQAGPSVDLDAVLGPHKPIVEKARAVGEGFVPGCQLQTGSTPLEEQLLGLGRSCTDGTCRSMFMMGIEETAGTARERLSGVAACGSEGWGEGFGAFREAGPLGRAAAETRRAAGRQPCRLAGPGGVWRRETRK